MYLPRRAEHAMRSACGESADRSGTGGDAHDCGKEEGSIGPDRPETPEGTDDLRQRQDADDDRKDHGVDESVQAAPAQARSRPGAERRLPAWACEDAVVRTSQGAS